MTKKPENSLEGFHCLAEKIRYQDHLAACKEIDKLREVEANASALAEKLATVEKERDDQYQAFQKWKTGYFQDLKNEYIEKLKVAEEALLDIEMEADLYDDGSMARIRQTVREVLKNIRDLNKQSKVKGSGDGE